jgi:hypothetical protein
MPVASDNLNLNLNLNLGATGASGGGATGYGRPRFNTEDMCKLLPSPFPPALPLPRNRYSDDWDAELRAWAYVEEFMRECNWGRGYTPVTRISDAINRQSQFPVPYRGATNPLTPALLASQVLGVLNAALDRADRAMEILDQATGQGALNYWTGLLRIDPSQDKHAFLLLLVARKIGEYVAMGLKDIYKMRRPSQVYPLILPLIDPPDTPSFPSSHSLQAHLMSNAIKLALPRGARTTAKALDHLADRVARNREIAGVHYDMDSKAGTFAAGECLTRLMGLGATSRFWRLVRAARGELRDLP